MRGSNFVFDCVHLLYHNCHKTNSNRDGSNTNSTHWIENKGNKCFQYSVTVALNHEDIGKRKHPKRTEKIKSYKNLE